MFTWVEISAHALAHNIRVFKQLADSKKIMVIVKSNAYGHGMNLVAKECARNNLVDAFGVANIEEALQLFHKRMRKPVIVLSILDIEQVALMTQQELNLIRLPLYDMATAHALFKTLKKHNLRARVHVKIDTGTSRIGFFPSQVSALANFLHSAKKHISLEAIYTHFADAEDDIDLTLKQNKLLLEAERLLHKAGFGSFYKHSACTAASVHSADMRMDMIRLGLGLYGLNPNTKIAALIQKKTGKKLEPALSWRSKLIQVKTIPKGGTVGYSRTFKARKSTTLGIVPVGYYDGYDRKLSNKGHMSVRGLACPVAGRVCMNLTMIDMSKIFKMVKAGDTVTLIGNSGKAMNADALARLVGTINYEVVTRINPFLQRIITK